MPIQPCTKDGKEGFKWGNSGKCYTGKDGHEKAVKQMKAIFKNGYKEDSMIKDAIKRISEASALQKAWNDAYRNNGTTEKKFQKLPCETKLEIAKEAFRNADMITPVDELVAKWKKENC